jgi:6-phosphogluconolactonase
MSGAPVLDVSDDADALARRGSEWLAERIAGAARPFALCLSGGSTPKRLYAFLAAAPLRDRIPWQNLHLFWGDERFVPPDHPDSNFAMARTALIDHVPIPLRQIHPIPTTGLTPETAAEAYARTLAAFYGSDRLDAARPLFDVTLLGLGPDGHTASLFPGAAALDETVAWTAAVIGARPEPRITLTYPVIASSAVVAFLVAGADKQAMLARVLAGDRSLPAARVCAEGELRFLVDRAAVGEST